METFRLELKLMTCKVMVLPLNYVPFIIYNFLFIIHINLYLKQNIKNIFILLSEKGFEPLRLLKSTSFKLVVFTIPPLGLILLPEYHIF